ncbi:MAG TPA: hypothetical protein LFW13_00525 [Rickettsia endosymbiont of Sericostoma sp.]|uniref:hypothetical protein n=2 Tax=unclassified Candidatus Tisiphia TaxID=2996318 RepID=UPI001DC44077|nr:hypothetical protein [Rickettsia endosymbiont of Sericostoma sp.]
MKYFSPSYLLTTSLVLLYTTTSTLARAVSTGSTLPKVVFTGKNTGIEKDNDSTSELDVSSSLPSIYQYHNDPALVKIIKEATEKPTYDDPVDNSDVALHNRSKRAADKIVEVKTLTLPNGSCVMVGKGEVYTPKHWLFSPERTNLYAKCLVDEPCQDQKFTSSEEREKVTWGDSLRELSVLSSTEPQTAQIVFTYQERYESGQRNTYVEKYKCGLPSSSHYEHFKECKSLKSNGKHEEALVECTKSLEAHPNFAPARKLLDELNTILEPVVTTIEPSSSTSFIEENSTIITEETTTSVDPSNAAFKDIAAPTATPQEQTTIGQEGKVMGAVYGAIAVIATVAAAATAYTCKKVKDIHYKRCNGVQKAIVASEDILSDTGEIMLSLLPGTDLAQNVFTIVESAVYMAEDVVSTIGNGSEATA